MLAFAIGSLSLLLSGCQLFSTERVIFNEQGIRVGVRD